MTETVRRDTPVDVFIVVLERQDTAFPLDGTIRDRSRPDQ
jgi:hypothetical protein